MMNYFICAVVILSAGCAAATGTFDETGFHATDNPYRITYFDTENKSLLNYKWTINNFYIDEKGHPYKAKTHDNHLSKIQLENPDGTTQELDIVTHDLFYQDDKTNAVIWVRVLPIPIGQHIETTEVLAQNFVNNLNGTAYESAYESAYSDVREIHFATKIIEQQSITVGGTPAISITFDIFNLEQLKLNSNAPQTRAKVVFVSVYFKKSISADREIPGRLMLGYSNDVDDFNDHIESFEDLLSRVIIEQ